MCSLIFDAKQIFREHMKPLWGLIGELDVNMQFYFGVTGIVCGLFIFRSFEYL